MEGSSMLAASFPIEFYMVAIGLALAVISLVLLCKTPFLALGKWCTISSGVAIIAGGGWFFFAAYFR